VYNFCATLADTWCWWHLSNSVNFTPWCTLNAACSIVTR